MVPIQRTSFIYIGRMLLSEPTTHQSGALQSPSTASGAFVQHREDPCPLLSDTGEVETGVQFRVSIFNTPKRNNFKIESDGFLERKLALPLRQR
jgi:hypothetical protein